MQPGWHNTSREGSSPLITSSEKRRVGGREAGTRVTWTDTSFNLIHWSMQQRGEARRGREIIKRQGPYKCAPRWHGRDWILKRRAKRSKAKRNTIDCFHSSDRGHWWGISYFNVFSGNLGFRLGRGWGKFKERFSFSILFNFIFSKPSLHAQIDVHHKFAAIRETNCSCIRLCVCRGGSHSDFPS